MMREGLPVKHHLPGYVGTMEGIPFDRRNVVVETISKGKMSPSSNSLVQWQQGTDCRISVLGFTCAQCKIERKLETCQ